MSYAFALYGGYLAVVQFVFSIFLTVAGQVTCNKRTDEPKTKETPITAEDVESSLGSISAD